MHTFIQGLSIADNNLYCHDCICLGQFQMTNRVLHTFVINLNKTVRFKKSKYELNRYCMLFPSINTLKLVYTETQVSSVNIYFPGVGVTLQNLSRNNRLIHIYLYKTIT